MTISKSIFLFLFCSSVVIAQTEFSLKGSFPQLLDKEITLKGFYSQKDSIIAHTKTDGKGQFALLYPAKYIGAAVLEIKDSKSVIVLLNKENFDMKWDNLEEFNTLKFTHSPENDAFGKGLTLYQENEAILAGLKYLKPLYEKELKPSLKAKKSAAMQWIDQEIAQHENGFNQFVVGLPSILYAKYYLNTRRLLSDMPATANRYIERMPQHEEEFNAIDFSSEKLIHSGLYKELLEGYFLLMESYGVDAMYPHINNSTDSIVKSLKNNTELQEEVAVHLFNLFEKRSLFPASEHLALAMLDDSSCQMDERREALFEQYRKMAKGNTAPDIAFGETAKGKNKLSELSNSYKLVVFGASWCSTCVTDIPKLKDYYEQWKNKYDLEVVFISLDIDAIAYAEFSKDFPWLNSCDFKGWETKSARDYCVFATPTMYLLDQNNKIEVKVKSAEHLNAWLEVKGISKY